MNNGGHRICNLGRTPDGYWNTDEGRAETRAFAATGFSMFAWCGELSSNYLPTNYVDDYLNTLDAFEKEFPAMRFIYQTGHTDGNPSYSMLALHNEMIRSYCRTNDKTLYDFADIESWDPAGNFYPESDESCWWATNWCALHPEDCVDLLPRCEGGIPTCCPHSHGFNCKLKAKAYWVMMARLAGWDPDAVSSNAPPVLDPIGDQAVSEGTTLTFTATASDPDNGQTLTFSLDAGAPDGATIDAASGVFRWTPEETRGPGTYTLTIRVTDKGSPALSNSETIQVAVAEVNAAPTLIVPGDQTVHQLATLVVTNTATDPDSPANSLAFDMVAGPSGMVVDPVTGILTWTPEVTATLGTNTVTVRVTDGSPEAVNAKELSDTKSFAVVVREFGLAAQCSEQSLSVQFLAMSGMKYRVEYREDLAAGSWEVLQDEIIGDGAVYTVVQALTTSSQRFFRVVLLP